MTYIDPNATVPARTFLAVKERCDELEETLAQIRAKEDADRDGKIALRCKQVFGLTPAQSRMLLALLRRELCSDETFVDMGLFGEDTMASVVKVQLSFMRKKLAPHGVKIETLWGEGYSLSAVTKVAVKRTLGIVGPHNEACLDEVAFECQERLGLSYAEAAILSTLLSREWCRFDDLADSYHTTKPDRIWRRSVAVLVCRLRKKLGSLGDNIQPYGREGYRLIPASKAIIRHKLGIDTKAAA